MLIYVGGNLEFLKILVTAGLKIQHCFVMIYSIDFHGAIFGFIEVVVEKNSVEKE